MLSGAVVPAGVVFWLALAGAQAEDVRFAGAVWQGERELVLLEFARGPGCRLEIGESCRGYVLEARAGETLRLVGPAGAVALDLAAPGAELRSAGPPPVPVPEPPAPEPPTPAPEPAPEGEPAARTLSRDEVRLRLPSELPRILSGSTVVPRIVGSESAGLELVSFPMDTVLGETGLVPGDVLLSVNGREVRGVESLAVLVQRFQTADELQILVDRSGELVPLTLTFQ